MSGKGGKQGFGDGQRRGDRMRQRVKTARGRKLSSTRWLERQLNDPYVAAAKADGYRSRAAYKIIEMDDRFTLFKPGDCVIDLGAAPGGWSQVAAQRVGATENKGFVAAIDIQDMEAIQGVDFMKLDFLDDDALVWFMIWPDGAPMRLFLTWPHRSRAIGKPTICAPWP